MIKSCPDCKGALEKGAILDQTYGAVIVQRYSKTNVADKPYKTVMSSYESNFDDVRRVITYRCTKCNRLFSYAQHTVLTTNLNSYYNKRIFAALAIAVGAFAIFALLALLSV